VLIPKGLVAEAEFRSAVDLVLANQPRLLPPDPATVVLGTHRDEGAAWAHSQAVGEMTPTPGDVVSAAKGKHGIRPVAVWDIPSKLLYTALSERLRPDLPDLVRGSESWNEFLKAPLGEPCDYVVVADIASCYDMIDHGLLTEELRVQRGDHDTIDTLIDLLAEVGRRKYGLPQQSASSDLLANAFLQRLERFLHRRGLRLWRYVDDFRIACDTWSEVVRAIEVLDEEARRHGLLLNDFKTFTWKRGNYEERLEHVEKLRQDIADEAEIDLQVWTAGQYEEPDEVEVDPNDVAVLASTRLLDLWRDIAGEGEVAPEQRDTHLAVLQLLPQALAILVPDPDDLADTLDILFQILRFEQVLTPAVCGYLTTVTDQAQLFAALDRFLQMDPYLSDWQMWWVLNLYGGFPGFTSGAGGATRLQWATSTYDRTAPGTLIRAHAALNLARLGALAVDRLMTDYDTSSPTARSTLAAAIAIAQPPPQIEAAVRADSQLHAWIFDVVQQAHAYPS
jgi:hypothetical protein